MKNLKFTLVIVATMLFCGTANAQLGGVIRRAAERGAERAVEKKAEQKAEEEVGKAVDKALEPAERERQRGEKELEKAVAKADSAYQASEAAEVDLSDSEIPAVADTPYTPSESEYTFFGMKTGLVQVFAQKDKNGKVTSQSRNTITAITGSRNAFAVDYQSELLDAKGNPTNKDNPVILHYRVVVANGEMFLDMKGMFGAIDGLDGVSASGTAMKIPNSLQVGQTLPDANASVRIGFIKMSVAMTEGKVLSQEDVTTAAGTFKCYKVSQATKAMGINGTTLTYYAKGVGAVKTDTLDKNGKLLSSTELISQN
ncbi:MAG: hypothetical protein LBR06_01675 [Bacteroidales bacterium]|jgi:hypothetical protein|nr:hypothetical protein [Bacteroidales bacterium]